jgi:catechol 2,3-dioxygenase-like lactoylglutathione lyase family enzyme
MGILASSRPITFILTRDRSVTLPFYRDVLGCTLVFQDGFAAVFDLGGVTMRLTDVQDHQPHPHTVIGWEVADIEAAVTALSANGVVFETYEGFGQDRLGIWSAPGGAARVCWFKDPEGNVLSLTWVRPQQE